MIRRGCTLGGWAGAAAANDNTNKTVGENLEQAYTLHLRMRNVAYSMAEGSRCAKTSLVRRQTVDACGERETGRECERSGEVAERLKAPVLKTGRA